MRSTTCSFVIGATVLVTACSAGSKDAATTPVVSQPKGLVFVTQPPALAPAGGVLTPSPVVQLVDAAGVAVAKSGVAVTLGVAASASTKGVSAGTAFLESCTASGTTTISSDAVGRATFTNVSTRGTAGQICQLFATSPGLTSATASPTTESAGPAVGLSAVTGTKLTVNLGVTAGIRVLISDVSNNGVPGATVNAVVSSGNGSLLTGSQISDLQGVASFSYIAALSAGTAVVHTTLSGSPTVSPVDFTFTIARSPAISVTLAPSTQSVPSGLNSTAQYAAVVKDAAGFVLTDRTIDWTTSSNAFLAASSTGSVSVSNLALPGTYTITATCEGIVTTAQLVVLPAVITGTAFFVAAVGSNDQIFKVTLPGGTPVQLTNTPGNITGLDDDPLDQIVLFSKGTSALGSDVFQMKDDGTGLVNLTNNPSFVNTGPVFLPGGLEILYSSTKGGALGNIFRRRIATGIESQITSASGFKMQPAVSPDGNWFAWVQDVFGINQVFFAPISGFNPQQATFGPSLSVEPAFVSNSQLLFASNRSGPSNVFSIMVPGLTNLTNLTNSTQESYSPFAPGCLANNFGFIQGIGAQTSARLALLSSFSPPSGPPSSQVLTRGQMAVFLIRPACNP